MKKKREQYNRTINIYRAAHDMNEFKCAMEALKIVNSDITGIVFSAALAKGIASADLRGFHSINDRKGWRMICYTPPGEDAIIQLCKIGPMEEDIINNPESETINYTYTFEWYRK